MIPAAGDITSGVPFSWNPLDDLQQLFQFEFERNAYAAGTAAAIAAGVVGYFVVLRGLSFAAHSLSQIGFAGATGALVANVDPIYGLLVVNGAGAGIIGAVGRRRAGRDVVVGLVLTSALGLGLLFLALSRAQEAVPVLVGDVLAVSAHEAAITEAAAVAILVAVAMCYRPLLLSSVDEELAEARGARPALMSVLLLLVLATATSVATPIVGVLLTFALLVGPAATAATLVARPGWAIAVSVALGVLYVWVGLAVSYWVDFPPGVFVTGMAFAGYLAARTIGGARTRPGARAV
ncbi:MAG TPA: metal ABC transporter permease [Candidatus Dormibacteraeota bacterium]|nr:metal ABC transporter permease [Candidatus Dormibacteraeota bacterium]